MRIIYSEIGDEGLIELDSGTSLILNETARIVWGLTRAGVAPEGVARNLAERFEVGEAAALADVRKILKVFAGMGLLEAVENGG